MSLSLPEGRLGLHIAGTGPDPREQIYCEVTTAGVMGENARGLTGLRCCNRQNARRLTQIKRFVDR